MPDKEVPISHIHEMFKKGELTPVELVERYLDRIKKSFAITNSFIKVFDEYALERARELEAKIHKYEELPLLFGIPVGIKDNINVKGFATTCASRILSGYKSLYNATVTDKILEQGGVVMGKLNMDEFAMGALGNYSFYGPVRNPHNPEFLAGGSSSGAAASVAAGEVKVSLGSDTGGSIRLPASFCGVFGLKPTYGRVSRYGLVAFACSLDQIGPLAGNVEDLARAYVSIAGYDPLDSTSVDIEQHHLSGLMKEITPDDMVLGYPDIVENARMDQEVKESFFNLLSELTNVGFRVKKVSLPHIAYSVEVYQLISTSEASSNLARYDGIRYGFRFRGTDLEKVYNKTRGEGFGEEVKRRILLGTFALSHGYYDEYYLKALKVRRLIKNDLDESFHDADLLILPVSPFPAPRLDEEKDPISLYYLDLFTIPSNLGGNPSMAIPWGKTHDNLPLGFQIVSPLWREDLLFNFATYFEKYFI